MLELTLEQMIRRLWDAEEVRKVMARYAYLHNAHAHEETAALFALERDDVWVQCGGIGKYNGPEGIRKFFIDWHHSLGGDPRGAFNEHLLTTELVEVAGDCQTAKAVWMSPGVETRRIQLPDQRAAAESDGELEAQWIWGKYAVDFIKVNGVWKFWHFTITMDFQCDFHHSWVETEKTLASRVRHNGLPPVDESVPFADGYTKQRVTELFPAPPDPYDTFDHSCGDYGIKSAKESI